MYRCVWSSEIHLRPASSPSTLLTSGALVCHYIYQASWPLKFQGFSGLCLPSHSRNSEITDTHFQSCFLGLLGTQNQVLTFVWQALYPPSHLPNLLYILKYKARSKDTFKMFASDRQCSFILPGVNLYLTGYRTAFT